jgi:TRAP-type C4-dicarboxylate transport system permease small subunit
MVPTLIFADGIMPTANSGLAGSIGTGVHMSTQPLDQTLNTIANYVIGVLIIVAVFYVIWAGYSFVMSNGDPEKTGEARKRIMFAAIGIIVALLAKGIISLVLSAIGS